MTRRYLSPLAESCRQRAQGGAGRRYVEAPYKVPSLMARLWDTAPAGRRVIRYYLPSRTPVWVDDLALWRASRSWVHPKDRVR